MLHHYNYSTSLSHFLSYHQLEEQQLSETEHQSSATTAEELSQQEDPRCRSNSSSSAANNKSFTIAAILGLNSSTKSASREREDDNNEVADLSVVNLSVHHHHHHGASSASSERTLNVVSGCNNNRIQLPVVRHSSVSGASGHFSVGHGCPQQRQTVRGLKQHMSVATGAQQQQQQQLLHSKKSCKSKRVRTIFTPEQLERLEAEFERQQYMVGPERLYLAHTLQLTEAQVKVWFQNRRIKWRKHHLELTHQRLAVLKQQQLLLDDSQPDVQDTNSGSSADT